jgi:hypothetical protein
VGDGRRRLALAVLAAVTFAASVATSRWLFPLYSVNRDDSVYVAMARLLETGHLTLPAGHDAFRPWASGIVGDRLVLKYTPPWPAVLAAADVLTGSPRIALGLVAAATVVLTALLAGEVLGDRTAGVLAGALLALSPLFLLQSALYLPYVFQLLLGLGFATLLLSGARRRSSIRLVAAGAVLGLAAFARPADTVLFAAPFLLLVLLFPSVGPAPEGGGWTRTAVVLRLAAGAAPLLGVALLYDAAVMGSPFRLPYTVTGPQDGFGFGRRGVFPRSTVPFDFRDGLSGMLANLRALPSWTFGGLVLVVLAAAGLALTTGRARWAVAGLAITVPLGYLPFWGPYAISDLWAGLETLGPYYHLPVLVPLTTFGAAALVALWRRMPKAARPLVAAGVAGLVVLTATAVPGPVAANLAIRDDYRAVQRFVDRQHLGSAVLLLPRRGNLGFISSTPFLENSPSLRQPVLYAEERGAKDFELVDRYPDRALYRLSEYLPSDSATGGSLRMDRLRVESGPAVTLRARLTNPTDSPVVVGYLTDGHRTWSRTLDVASVRGRSYDVSWTVAAPGAVGPPDGSAVPLPGDPPAGVLAMGLELRPAGDGTGAAGRRWEQRVAYRLVEGSAGGQGAAQVQVLVPGEGWASRATGGGWVQLGAGNPVELG